MTERILYNSSSQQVLFRSTSLTGTAETSYAKRGSARMQDTLQKELQVAPVEVPVLFPHSKNKEEEKKLEEKEKPQLKALEDKVDKVQGEIKKKSIDRWTHADLRHAYASIHKELSMVKFLTSPKTFVKALATVGPVEHQLREEMVKRKTTLEDMQLLRSFYLTDEAKKKKAPHLNEKISEDALRHVWKQFYTPQELKDEETQKGIEAAVAAGFLPVGETDKEEHLDEQAKHDLRRQRELIRQAEEVAEHAEIKDDEERKQKAWDVLIRKRHAEKKDFDVTKLDQVARQREINAILIENEREQQRLEYERQKKKAEQEGKTIPALVLVDPTEESLPELQKRAEAAIIAAHNVGLEDEAKGVYNYSLPDLKKKYEMLEDANIQAADIRELMEAGIAGRRGGRRGGGGGAQTLTFEEEIAAAPEEEQETVTEMLNRMYGRDVREDLNQLNFKQADEREVYLHNKINEADAEAMKTILGEGGAIEGNLRHVASYYANRNAEINNEVFIKNYVRNFDDQFQAARDALSSGNLDEAKRLANELAHTIGQREREFWEDEPRFRERISGANPERMQSVNDFDDVLKEIIQFDPISYGDDGLNPLYQTVEVTDPDGTKRLKRTGEINQGNFKKWVQERMVYHSNFDPDAPIQFFSAVALENNNLYRSVSLGLMVSQYTQFFRRKGSDVVLEELKDEIVDMGWLDGTLRNTDVNYRQGMTNDTKFGDVMIEAFKGNVLGKEATRSGVNSLASIFMTDANFDPTKKAGEGDMKIGMATESAFLFYYNMTDEEKLEKLFDKHLDIFFSYERMQDAITHAMIGNNRDYKDNKARERFIQEAGLSEILKKAYGREVTGHVRVETKVDADGNEVLGPDGKPQIITHVLDSEKGATIIDKKAFLEEMNVFNPPMKNRFKNTVSRNLVKFVAGAEAGLVDDTFENKSEHMHAKGTLDFAEMRAFWMTYPLGAAARQDVGYAAINAMTKVTHFQQYLNKQANPSRAGGIGNPLEFPLLKAIAADPVTGVLTDKEKSTLYMIERLHEIRRDKSLSEEEMRDKVQKHIGQWTYKDLAWKQYAPQHMANAFKEFHDRTSGKEIHIDSFASFDMWGHLVYDHAKMISEVQEGLIKPSRYRWSTHRLDYEEMRRELVDHGHGISYQDSCLAEEMYGPQVLINATKMQLHEYEVILKTGSEEDKEKVRKLGVVGKNGKILDYSVFIDEKGRYRRKIGEDGKEKSDELSAEAKALVHTKDYGRVVTRAYLMSKFAVQLHSVTQYGTGHKRLDYATRELVIATLGHIPAGIHVDDPTDFRSTHLTEFYFNDYDLKLMREMSGNGPWQNFFRAAGMELTGGGFEVLGKGFKEFFKNIMKI